MKKKINFSTILKIITYTKFLPAIIVKIKNWPTFLLYYIGIKDGGFECIFRNGTKIRISDNIGAATIAVIFIKRDYGVPEKNSTVIDIGANIGVYSIFAGQKNNKVYAFEPMEENFKLLEENIKGNNLDTMISPYQLAVTGKKEKRRLYLGGSPFHSLYPIDDSPFNALYKEGAKVEQNFIDINCVSLEDIFLDNKIAKCDMLKIDCEGSEFEIFYGLKDEYFTKIAKIRMEYHNHKTNENFNGKRLAEFLKGKGFKVEKFRKSSPSQGDVWLTRD